MNNVAARYAQSLFELAIEEQQLDRYMKDLSFVNQSLDDEAIAFFHHPIIDFQEKINVLDKAFKDVISTYLLNFLKLLIQKHRFNQLRLMIEQFSELKDEHYGIKKGFIYSAKPLNEKEIKDIEAVMSKKEDKIIQLSVVIDESLIGGIKVVIGDQVIDGSIKNRIDSLRKELLKGKVGEQSGT